MSDILVHEPGEDDVLNNSNISDELADVTEIQAEPKVIEGAFRRAELPLPREVRKAPGIKLYNHLVRSFVFSTDLVVIRNCDADAVLAVYPFTCQPAITQALLTVSERPVVTGVAGATTTGVRSVLLAAQSEMQGASGVAVNIATKPVVIRNIARSVDIPVVLTVSELTSRTQLQIAAGARIINISAGRETPRVVEAARRAYLHMPIIASGGGTPESIMSTINAGADAVSWTPPSLQEIERQAMRTNRARAEGTPAATPLGRLLRR